MLVKGGTAIGYDYEPNPGDFISLFIIYTIAWSCDTNVSIYRLI